MRAEPNFRWNCHTKIYLFLEEKRHLKIEDIPNNLEDFQVTLNEIFGRGALLIEKTIMEKPVFTA